MKFNPRKYNSKVLLLGEYTVTLGGKGLASPYTRWNVYWTTSGKNKELLYEFYDFLEREEFDFLDYDGLSDLRNSHLGLECNIPIGYGLGSSGAITAAVYEHLCPEFKEKEIGEVKKELVLMEGFYHGTSSGIDPLVSLVDRPLIMQEEEIAILNIRLLPEVLPEELLYLYDSGMKRSSQKLIRRFVEHSKVAEYRIEFLEPLKENVNRAIECLVEEKDDFTRYFKEISRLQYAYMQEMITESIKPLWKKGLETGEYYFKICGAGGGGMYLVMKGRSLEGINEGKLISL